MTILIHDFPMLALTRAFERVRPPSISRKSTLVPHHDPIPIARITRQPACPTA